MLFSSIGARQVAAGAMVTVLACCASTFASAPVLAAPAPSPATVIVRVEGLDETKLPPTQVTTTDAPVIQPGEPTEHACPGTSALGALQIATGGDWAGTWYTGLGYSLETIEGENLPFESTSEADYYWDFWLNDKESAVGACGAELESGDEALFFPACYGKACPPEEATPLGIEAPATAGVREPVIVTVKQYNSLGESKPAVDATVAGDGAKATTNSEGHATLSFTNAGSFLLRVTGSPTGPASVRTEAPLCVHNGNDGTCGTKAPAEGSSTTVVSQVVAPPYTGPYAVVADVTGLVERHHYRRAGAPRLLTGVVTAPTAIRDVQMRLTRTLSRAHGANLCSYYDGSDDRFHAMRCGAAHGQFFSVGDSAKFSYLLPSPLPPGRYVLDISASDLAGSTSKLARGSSRIVFYVE